MPDTITSYNTFAASTKARASEVNTNFSNHRGTLVPINSDTATASTNTHDFGSEEHRWRNAYLGKIDFRSSTNTASLTLEGDTSNTTGAFLFGIEGVTKAKIDTDGMDGSFLKIQSVTITALSSKGSGPTTTAAIGQVARSPTWSTFGAAGTSASANISGSTVTCATSGRPVLVTIDLANVVAIFHTVTTYDNAGIGYTVFCDNSTTGIQVSATWQPGYVVSATSTGQAAGTTRFASFPLNISSIHPAGAGTHNYHVQISFNNTVSSTYVTYNYLGRLTVVEI